MANSTMNKVKIMLQVQDSWGNQFMLSVTSDDWGVLKYSLSDLTRSTGFALSNMNWKLQPPTTIHGYDKAEDMLTELRMCIMEHTPYDLVKTIVALKQTPYGAVEEMKNA